MKLMDDGSIYFPTESGQWISEKQRRISEIIKDYDANLELQWIPPQERGPQDYAFRVVARYPNVSPYVVCFSEECDERLLTQIIMADQKNTNTLNYLDAHNSALELYNLKKISEKRKEAIELAGAIIRNQKSHFRHGGYDYERPRDYQPRQTYIW